MDGIITLHPGQQVFDRAHSVELDGSYSTHEKEQIEKRDADLEVEVGTKSQSQLLPEDLPIPESYISEKLRYIFL